MSLYSASKDLKNESLAARYKKFIAKNLCTHEELGIKDHEDEKKVEPVVKAAAIVNNSNLVCEYDLNTDSKDDKDDKKDFFIKVEQMNEANKHSFYIIDQDKAGANMFTRFSKNDLVYNMDMDEAQIDSKRFLSIFDKTNDWVLSKVEYGPIEKPPTVEVPSVEPVEVSSG